MGFDDREVWFCESASSGVTALHAIDPRTAQVRTGPIEGAPRDRTGAAGVWTGIDLVVWGGLGAQAQTVHADGALFRP